MNFNSDGNPTVTALYLVNRDKQGKAYRWYNAETDQWGMCGADMNEAVTNKDVTAVGFYPWVGPLTGPNFKTKKRIVEVVETETKSAPIGKKSKRMAKKAPSAVTAKVKAPKQAKVTHPDGTVFFRADRQKWVAVYAGKQEAARPTAEACLNFLKKKYNVVGNVIK